VLLITQRLGCAKNDWLEGGRTAVPCAGPGGFKTKPRAGGSSQFPAQALEPANPTVTFQPLARHRGEALPAAWRPALRAQLRGDAAPWPWLVISFRARAAGENRL